MPWLEKRRGTWFVCFRNSLGKRERLWASRDKVVAKSKLGEVETAIARGEKLTDPYAAHKARSIVAHVEDWLASLVQLGRDDVYVAGCRTRLGRLITECGWKVLDDIAPDSIDLWRTTALTDTSHNAKDQENRKREPMGARTKNHYLEACRCFCNWAVKRKRMAANPLLALDKVDETDDVRRARRAASDGELRRFMAVLSPEHHFAYWFLVSTGLRRQETLDLIWGDIHLDGPTPFIRLRASTTKAKRADELPLRQDLAQELRDRRGGAQDADAVFRRLPTMVRHRKYLAAARTAWLTEVERDPRELARRQQSDFLLYMDSQGKRLDVHAFRHTYGTMLSKSGVMPREAMELMRHTDLRLTMKHYTDPRVFDLASAVGKLPSFRPGQSAQTAKATGTHDLMIPEGGGANGGARIDADRVGMTRCR